MPPFLKKNNSKNSDKTRSRSSFAAIKNFLLCLSMSRKQRVSYFYDPEIGNFYYGQGHPMKPHRIRMTHNLLLNYGLYKKMEVFRPNLASAQEMQQFHSDDYVKFLETITPENLADNLKHLQRFNVGDDCPVFEGLYEFCQLSAGGSIGAAVRLNQGKTDIAVNWAGGLHHAKKCEASGFCYINDIVLAILELLKVHQRVLYIDIDIHHGDGVEEAFYTTDRVMTVSFHKYGEYFPGTGSLKDVGAGKGKYYSVNFPLRDGIDDATYQGIFRPVLSKVMEMYDPGAIVLQSGADSLTGDRLGSFNLSLKGHGDCIEFMKSFGKPVLVLGGGGYTIRNVARCWAYETAVCLGEDLSNELPYNDYYEYFGPDHTLHISPSNMVNHNSDDYLEKTKIKIFDNLRHIPHAPGVTPNQQVPDSLLGENDDSDEENPDVRKSQKHRDRTVIRDDDYDSDGEGKKKNRTDPKSPSRSNQSAEENGSKDGTTLEQQQQQQQDADMQDAEDNEDQEKSQQQNTTEQQQTEQNAAADVEANGEGEQQQQQQQSNEADTAE